MPRTEIQRYVLLAALGVVGYLLVYNWTQDYGQPPTELAPREAPQASDPGAENEPATPTGLAPLTDDVPDDALAGEAALPLPAAVETEAGQLVRVRTPTQEVWIDRLGGDIVGLDLPGYSQAITVDKPVQLLDRRSDHVYVAQSGLTGRDGLDRSGARPLYTTTRSDYGLESGELEVALRHERDGAIYWKRFRFDAKEYLIEVEHEIVNRSASELRTRLFAQLKRDSTRPASGGGFMGPRPYVGAAFTTPESRYEKIDFEDLDEAPFRTEQAGGWAAMLQHYFIAAWIGDPEQRSAYNGRRLNDGNYAVGLVGPELIVAPGDRAVAAVKLYAGPKIQKRLEAAAPNLYLTVDYGLFWWLSVPLFYVLDAIHEVVLNWGVAIILLTLVVKVLLFPLASAGFRSMARMKQVMPQVQRLRERYGSDRQKMTQEMMALYKKEGANPLGGCLPLLLQMPVFFALYWVLYESVELRHAPFVFWIKDLAAADPWFVLPLLYAGSFYVMQRMQPPPPDPMQAKMMKMMPLMFGVLFVFFPAGLVLYWLVNNLLSMAQQWYITRSIERKAASTAA